MEHRIYAKYSDIPPALRRKLRSLSYRNDGCMCDALNDLRNGEKGKVSVLCDEDKVISWAIQTNAQFYSLQAYTRKKFRNKGYGQVVSKALVKKRDRVFTGGGVISGEYRKHFWKKVKGSLKARK